MIHIVADELHSVVLGLVQTDNVRNSEVSEDLEIVFWSVPSFSSASRLVYWPHKSNKLVGDNPV